MAITLARSGSINEISADVAMARKELFVHTENFCCFACACMHEPTLLTLLLVAVHVGTKWIQVKSTHCDVKLSCNCSNLRKLCHCSLTLIATSITGSILQIMSFNK